MKKTRICLICLALLLSPGSRESLHARTTYEVGLAPFALAYKDEIVRYAIMAAFVLPGESLEFRIQEDDGKEQYHLEADAGSIRTAGARVWTWQAPDSAGLAPLRFCSDRNGGQILLNVFVLVPLDRMEGQYLEGYRIGLYNMGPPADRPIYLPPRGLVRVTEENRDTPVSPHFTLGQFLCKQSGGYPKFVALKPRLLRKLERALQLFNEAGYSCNGFGFISGYRTPWYNKSIGNSRHSRHVWGGAADVFIDENPRDGRMDDLNGDGKINVKDAKILYDILEKQSGKPKWNPFIGGMGLYSSTSNHGPFLHVDERGYRRRWQE